jgi:hypothetical protein
MGEMSPGDGVKVRDNTFHISKQDNNFLDGRNSLFRQCNDRKQNPICEF